MAKAGYDAEQNPSITSTIKNPDYLIEGQVFDCYAPQENTSVRNIASNINSKITNGQTERIILNLNDWTGNVDDLINQLNNWPIDGLKEVKIINGANEVINIYP